MSIVKKSVFCGLVAWMLVFSGGVAAGHAQPKVGQPAPLFLLKNPNGQSYELATMKDQPMVIIYFFDVDSSSSIEGLLHLDSLAKQYKDADLVVWGITRSSRSKVKGFASRSKLSFPVLIDGGKVSDIYAARMILPTVCIIGPDLRLLDYFQGGGKNTEKMLVALAERKLQNRQAELAKAISTQVTKKNPKNVQAKTVTGYAELKEGDLKAAEKTFYEISRDKGRGEILGKEGLSQVYAQKGQPEKALKLTEEVEAKAGQRPQSHVVKGDLLYSQNKTKAAEAEYRKAIGKSGGPSTHRAVAYNQLGRIYAMKGDYTKSRDMYDKAVALDPYYIEATSNKGMVYERQGQWDRALESYRRAQAIDRNDPFAAALAENAKKMLLLNKDPDQRKKMEQQIDTYVRRYKEGAAGQFVNPEDPWTTGPMALTLVEPHESGGLSKRDGFGRVLGIYLASHLNASGRVKVIEPAIMDRVIKKLGLKRKDLAKADVALRLANAFNTRLIGKGTLYHLSDGTLLNLKLMEVDGPDVSHTVQRQFASSVTLRKDLHWLNREILTTVMTQYPLKAFVVEVTGNQILLNLGADQGVVPGALFDVVEVKPPVNFKGKLFQPEPAVMATIEVVQTDPDFSYAHIKEQRRPIKVEDKLRERAGQIDEDGQRVW
ncbi:MAG: tetratricopeptide repeat protein [Desulfobacteraceae bacterium]|jgi:tetratricopeptide (TPR) repeat protein